MIENCSWIYLRATYNSDSEKRIKLMVAIKQLDFRSQLDCLTFLKDLNFNGSTQGQEELILFFHNANHSCNRWRLSGNKF